MDATTLAALRAELERDRAQSMELLDEHGADPYDEAVKHLQVGNGGFADSAQATEERAELLGAIEASRHRIQQIDAALARMDAGSYGVCVDCGTTIAEERLEVRPLSVSCVDCAGRAG